MKKFQRQANRGLFWRFSNSGPNPHGGRQEDRLWVDLEITFEQELELRAGMTLPYDVYPVIGRAERADRLEDCPWISSDIIVVSTRLRILLESLASQQCQYIPVRVENQGKQVSLDYWIVNSLHVINCIDLQRSIEFRHGFGDGVVPSFYHPTIDSSRVPANAAIFRVELAESALMAREHVRRAVQQAGMSGLFFIDYEIALNKTSEGDLPSEI